MEGNLAAFMLQCNINVDIVAPQLKNTIIYRV